MPSRSLPEALVRAAVQPLAEGADADLLGRFVQDRDASAFEALVRRHGPMVLGVCRRALGNTPDADDAFQAVWLVLVRKARSISPRGKVGNWLYGVAARTATHTRSKNARRFAAQRELPDVPDPRPANHDATELATAVDAELTRLPDRYRAAVVLCELEGRSLKDAAEQIGVPLGTLASRLSRGRALLAARLKARGFAAAVVAGWFATAMVPVSARLTELTVSLLKVGPQEVAQSVSELTRGVLSIMLANKLKSIGQTVLAVALAVGAVVWVATAGAQPTPPPPTPPQSGPPTEHKGDEFAGRLDPRLPRQPWEEAAWDKLWRDEPYASRGVLEFAASPKAAVAFFGAKLKPLKTDKAAVTKWIADLDSDKDDVWNPAYIALDYFDPVLVMTPAEAWAEAKGHRAKHRLAALMTGRPEVMTGGPVRPDENDMALVRRGDGFRVVIYDLPFPERGRQPGRGPPAKEAREFPVAMRAETVQRPAWTQVTRAVVILEHIGTPEALAVLKEMATGHPDALPTVTAKQAVARITAPTP